MTLPRCPHALRVSSCMHGEDMGLERRPRQAQQFSMREPGRHSYGKLSLQANARTLLQPCNSFSLPLVLTHYARAFQPLQRLVPDVIAFLCRIRDVSAVGQLRFRVQVSYTEGAAFEAQIRSTECAPSVKK